MTLILYNKSITTGAQRQSSSKTGYPVTLRLKIFLVSSHLGIAAVSFDIDTVIGNAVLETGGIKSVLSVEAVLSKKWSKL